MRQKRNPQLSLFMIEKEPCAKLKTQAIPGRKVQY